MGQVLIGSRIAPSPIAHRPAPILSRTTRSSLYNVLDNVRHNLPAHHLLVLLFVSIPLFWQERRGKAAEEVVRGQVASDFVEDIRRYIKYTGSFRREWARSRSDEGRLDKRAHSSLSTLPLALFSRGYLPPFPMKYLPPFIFRHYIYILMKYLPPFIFRHFP